MLGGTYPGDHRFRPQKYRLVQIERPKLCPREFLTPFFELDHEILHTYPGRQYLKLEEGGFFIWGFAVEILSLIHI